MCFRKVRAFAFCLRVALSLSFKYLIVRLEVSKETKNYVLFWFYQISIKGKRFWVTDFFHNSWFKYSTGDIGTISSLSSAKINCFENLVAETVIGETNLFGRKTRFNTTGSSFDGCSVQIIVGIL